LCCLTLSPRPSARSKRQGADEHEGLQRPIRTGAHARRIRSRANKRVDIQHERE
jgi:hypothetical protein